MKYLLGIDDGGSVTKAAVYTMDGTLVAVCGGDSIPLKTPGRGFTERDMDALWRSNVTAIQRVLAQAGITGADIAAISATGHGNGVYLVDAEGRPAYNAIISTDERAESLIEGWVSDPRFTGRILPRTAQSLWAGQPPALLAWFKANRPEVLERSRWALLASGFVRMRLTGRATANLSDVSGTSLFNVDERRYDPQILDFYGIGDLEAMMPPVVGSDEQAGAVTEAAAAETGLVAGTPVAGGVFDIASSALASGLVEKNRLAIVTGTWSINEYIADAAVIDPDLFMTSIYPTPHAWLIMEGSPTSAGIFEWFINSVLGPAVKLAGGTSIGRDELYDAVNRVVFDPETENSEIPAFLPFVFGTSKYPGLRGELSELQASTGLPQILRSVYEGVVFSHMDHIRRLEKFQSLPDEAVFTGGVANSPLWTQMFADAMQRSLHVVKVKEAGTLGTVMAAAAMIGEYSDVTEAAKAMAPGYVEFTPDPAKASLYVDRYGAWADALAKADCDV
ncbi:MAG: carbohydrate kinase [Acidipropionibacterium sp.]|jgi:L-xylulokinase|nr:carbohydrate kinase [Acidipropionibacterium sp.]